MQNKLRREEAERKRLIGSVKRLLKENALLEKRMAAMSSERVDNTKDAIKSEARAKNRWYRYVPLIGVLFIKIEWRMAAYHAFAAALLYKILN
jgi:hypothetical protein